MRSSRAQYLQGSVGGHRGPPTLVGVTRGFDLAGSVHRLPVHASPRRRGGYKRRRYRRSRRTRRTRGRSPSPRVSGASTESTYPVGPRRFVSPESRAPFGLVTSPTFYVRVGVGSASCPASTSGPAPRRTSRPSVVPPTPGLSGSWFTGAVVLRRPPRLPRSSPGLPA